MPDLIPAKDGIVGRHQWQKLQKKVLDSGFRRNDAQIFIQYIESSLAYPVVIDMLPWIYFWKA
jgi:hypothetical protein